MWLLKKSCVVIALYYGNYSTALGAVGSVRLTGGLIPQQGQVEVCLNGSWSRVCSSSWNQRDAVVACRQLNFPVSELSKKIV